MQRALLKLSVIFPPLGMLVPVIWSLFVPGYSSIGQQMSELEMVHGAVAAGTRIGALIAGLSIVAFGLALLLRNPLRMPFTAAFALLFGVSMMSNGVFIMGSSLHGLYGIGLSVALTPALFAAEFPRSAEAEGPDRISLLASVVCLFYMWLLLTGLDPSATKGLTQRLACLPLFGWHSYASIKMLNRLPRDTLQTSTSVRSLG